MHPNTKHGWHGTPTYQSWICMRQRCLNPNAADFPRYGGRGIRVCQEWESFPAFLRDMGERPPGKTLDRRDTNGDYCKENCRWLTNREQLRNTRVNRMLTCRGETKCLAAWAEEIGIDSVTIIARLRRGWTAEKALSTPLNVARIGRAHNQKMITHDGQTRNIKEWAKIAGMNHHTLWRRITKYGMSFADAILRPVGKNGRKSK